ncbi:MAG: hypothetical protein JW873_01425 [Candidatus Saganbacteria bacterium]|nr:hypothetical protein [Candidatus Saganbacteria bacterium]
MPQLNNKIFALLTVGIVALGAQVIFLRELIAVFGGNELIYGLIMGLWLLLYASGAVMLGRFADKVSDKQAAFVLTQAAVMILLPLLLFLTRLSSVLFGLEAGCLIALPTIIGAALLVLAPLTVALGFQFALGSALLKREAEGISQNYLLEASGSFLCGLLLSLFLLNYLGSFQIFMLIVALLAASGCWLGPQKWRRPLVVLATCLLLISPWLDRLSNQLAWRGQTLVRSVDSPYGKLAVTRSRNDFNYYFDGSLLASTADKPLDEEFIGLTMIRHEKPDKVLLIGGGFSGMAEEILRYPVKRLDYVELDPKLLELAGKQLPPSVRVLIDDGIHYIKRTGDKYDIVIINLPDPRSALLNRYYTREFYRHCQKILEPGGLLAFKLPGSPDFMSRETRLLNASVNKTVSQLFAHVLVIGGSRNYYFASDQKLRTDIKRLRAGRYFKLPALRLALSAEKLKYVNSAVAFGQKTAVNTDRRPVSYFDALLIWASYFGPPVKDLLYALMRVNLSQIFAALVLFFALCRLFKPGRLPVMVGAAGFAGMAGQFIVMFVFQAQFGYLYQALALLTAAFMAGLAGGACGAIRYRQLTGPAFILGLLAFILFSLTLIIQSDLNLSLYPLFSFIIGGLVGAFFQSAVKLGEEKMRGVGDLAGKLYGADLLGSALAAGLVCVYFIPVFGLTAAGLLAGAIVVFSLLLI